MANRLDFYVYPHQFPQVKEVVIGEVVQRTDLGFEVVLTEYRYLKAFMPINEISRRRVRNIHKLMKVGMKNVQFKVLKSNPETGAVDISRRYLDRDDLKLYGVLSGYAKIYNLIALDLYEMLVASEGLNPLKTQLDQKRFKQLREVSVWKIFNIDAIRIRVQDEEDLIQELPKTLKNVHQQLIQNPEKLLDHEMFSDDFKVAFLKNYHQRTEVASGKLTQKIGIFSSARDGVARIRQILSLNKEEEEYQTMVKTAMAETPVEVTMLVDAPPNYQLSLQSVDMEKARQLHKLLVKRMLVLAKKLDCQLSVQPSDLVESRPAVMKVVHVSKRDFILIQEAFETTGVFDMSDSEPDADLEPSTDATLDVIPDKGEMVETVST